MRSTTESGIKGSAGQFLPCRKNKRPLEERAHFHIMLVIFLLVSNQLVSWKSQKAGDQHHKADKQQSFQPQMRNHTNGKCETEQNHDATTLLHPFGDGFVLLPVS